MKIFARNGPSKQKRLDQKLNEAKIPYEYNKSTGCYIYIDLQDNKTVKIYEKEDQYEYEGKLYSETDIFAILNALNKNNSKIKDVRKEESFTDFFDAAEFFNRLLILSDKKTEIVPDKEKISLLIDKEEYLSEIDENESKEFLLPNGSNCDDIETAVVRTFECLYDHFKWKAEAILNQIDKDNRFYYYIKRYLLSRVLTDKINDLMDTEAQIVDANGTIFIMMKNGSGIEYCPPDTETKTPGYIKMNNSSEMRRTEDNKDFNMVMKILRLTELIVPAT